MARFSLFFILRRLPVYELRTTLEQRVPSDLLILIRRRRRDFFFFFLQNSILYVEANAWIIDTEYEN